LLRADQKQQQISSEVENLICYFQFVAKKTTKEAVEKREIGSSNAKKKKYQHHMGPMTFRESRKEWITSGFYPG
ncbi:hypothetical protein SOVF_169330, partial [Spinacia oleracea]